jgi:hypothetical protein
MCHSKKLLTASCLAAGLWCATFTSSLLAEGGNMLAIGTQRVLPGQQGVWVPVWISNEVAIQGFQLMATYDATVLSLEGHSLRYTVTAQLEPEFLQVNDRRTHIEVGCLFDFLAPFDHRGLSPRQEARLLHLVFDVSRDAVAGTRTTLRLADDPALSQVLNIFTAEGRSLSPQLLGATVEVVRQGDVPESLFTRGDVDSSGTFDLADVLVVLNYLFLRGPPPLCLDAADFHDSGKINVRSVISLLGFLFREGPPPSMPFPAPGLDPTPDPLGCQ